MTDVAETIVGIVIGIWNNRNDLQSTCISPNLQRSERVGERIFGEFVIRLHASDQFLYLEKSCQERHERTSRQVDFRSPPTVRKNL
jgi:hypothetical protein